MITFRGMVKLTIVIATIIFMVAVLRIALHGDEAFATGTEQEIIDAKAAAALELQKGDDTEAYVASVYELYELQADASPTCAVYASYWLVSVVVLEEWNYFPNDIMLENFHSALLEQLPISQYDCNVAL